MNSTNHAVARGQQRGIPKEIIDTVLLYGQPKRKIGNALEYSIRKKDRAQIISSLKHMIKKIEKAGKKAVLLSGEENLIITVYPTG